MFISCVENVSSNSHEQRLDSSLEWLFCHLANILNASAQGVERRGDDEPSMFEEGFKI